MIEELNKVNLRLECLKLVAAHTHLKDIDAAVAASKTLSDYVLEHGSEGTQEDSGK